MRSLWLSIVSLLFACGGQTPVAPAPAVPPAPRPVITDGVVDVGNGLTLHIHCVGEGTPIVVLDTGLGGDGSSWKDVQRDIARFTRACAYDRAGTGYSTPAPRPHTSKQMAEELHTLLNRAGLAGPYVLVGHSLGGINVRLFASEFATDVAGMVLVDAAMEGQDTRFWPLLPEQEQRNFKERLAKGPEGIDYEAFIAAFSALRTGNRSLGDKPLVVLTRGREDPDPGVPPEARARLGRAWQEMQAELPRLSSNSVQLIAANSGHMIPMEAPRMLVGSVRAVEDAARTHGPLDKGTLEALRQSSVTADQAVARLFTQPLSEAMFAPSFLSEIPVARIKEILDGLSRDLGAFKQVVRHSDQITIQLERGSVPTEAGLNEDGQFMMLFFHKAVPAPEPPRPSSAPQKPASPAH
jgi:pimeloyl-ACP methyl ester carboxylesterase